MHFAGKYRVAQQYEPGALVIHLGYAYVARRAGSWRKPPDSHADWVPIAPWEPHPIGHMWHPEEVMFPLEGGTYSDSTPVCSDCWAENNFGYAFDSMAHTYIIQEMP